MQWKSWQSCFSLCKIPFSEIYIIVAQIPSCVNIICRDFFRQPADAKIWQRQRLCAIRLHTLVRMMSAGNSGPSRAASTCYFAPPGAGHMAQPDAAQPIPAHHCQRPPQSGMPAMKNAVLAAHGIHVFLPGRPLLPVNDILTSENRYAIMLLI